MAGSERGVRGDLGCRGEGWVAWKCMSASQRGGRGGSRRRISPSYSVYVMELDGLLGTSSFAVLGLDRNLFAQL